jgi:hypothetical protein
MRTPNVDTRMGEPAAKKTDHGENYDCIAKCIDKNHEDTLNTLPVKWY